MVYITYQYIIFGGDVRLACDNAYGIALGLDNLSDTLKELPRVSLDITPSCKGQRTGSVTVTIKGSHPPYTFTGIRGNVVENTVSEMGAGEYTMVVYDGSGTSATHRIRIPETDFSSKAAVVSQGCFGDNKNMIVLTTTDGVQPYTYYFNGSNETTSSAEFAFLYAGNYDVVIADAKGCYDTLFRINVKDPPPLRFAQIAMKKLSCVAANDGELILTPSGGIPPYTYSIQHVVTQPDSIIRFLQGGSYICRITDSQGCYIESNINMPYVSHECAVYIPNAFSPDGDGRNDLFRVKVYNVISDFRMSVYNRWGQLVFVSTDPANGWNGERNGVKLPAGTYLWTVTYTDYRHQPIQQTGSVLMIK
jgi:gliding motility-associated-like protein